MVVVPVPGPSVSDQKIYINLTNSMSLPMSLGRTGRSHISARRVETGAGGAEVGGPLGGVRSVVNPFFAIYYVGKKGAKNRHR